MDIESDNFDALLKQLQKEQSGSDKPKANKAKPTKKNDEYSILAPTKQSKKYDEYAFIFEPVDDSVKYEQYSILAPERDIYDDRLVMVGWIIIAITTMLVVAGVYGAYIALQYMPIILYYLGQAALMVGGIIAYAIILVVFVAIAPYLAIFGIIRSMMDRD